MASTYTPIATTSINTNTTSVTYSSISGSYTDLIAVVQGTADNNNTPTGMSSFGFTVNGDTGANYSRITVYGNGTSAASGLVANETKELLGQINPSNIGNTIFHFMNYSNTTTYKTFLSRADVSSNIASAWIGTWRSTSAINSITFGYFDGGGNFKSGTTITLYGITAA